MTEEQKRCEDSIAFANSIGVQFLAFKDKTEKDLVEKTKALSTLLTYVNNGEENLRDAIIKGDKNENDLQKLMAEMIRLAKVIELERAAKLIVKPSDIQVKLQPDKNIWDWLKELRK